MAANRQSPAFRRPQFFKIFLPSSSQRLRIPPKFVPQLAVAAAAAGEGQRTWTATATILSPLGKFWHVDVEVCRDGPEAGESASLGRGWPEFVAAHGLAPGHLLVFSYEGNMIFTLQVFDRTGCLKQDYSNTSNVLVPGAVVVDHHHHHHREVARAGTLINEQGRSLGERQKRVSEPNLSNVKQSPKVEEKSRNQKASKKNCYEKRIRLYNIEKYMTISKLFCTSHGLLALHKVVIKDSRRRSWVVSLGSGATYCYLGKGWRDFCAANKVKVGDTCIFTVAGKNELHVSVRRYKVGN